VLCTKYTVTRDRDDPNATGNHRKNLRNQAARRAFFANFLVAQCDAISA
jgi:hypothetical protein